jgi:hypothetical protein
MELSAALLIQSCDWRHDQLYSCAPPLACTKTMQQKGLGAVVTNANSAMNKVGTAPRCIPDSAK